MKEPKHEIILSRHKVELSGIFAWAFHLTLFGAFLEGIWWIIKDLSWLGNWIINLF